jgi:predicted O-methyltransferase YrrM
MKLRKRVLRLLGLKEPKPPRLPPEVANWYEGKELTSDWLPTGHLLFWFPALQHLRERSADVLEIGSYEGRSAIAFLEALPKCHVTTVDIFDDPEVEARCKRNLASYAHRAEIIKMAGAAAIEMLSGKLFDVIYLDAEKTRHGAFAHSALAWPILKVGGIRIWDDFRWGEGQPDDRRPGSGIELFCSTFKPCLAVLHQDWQIIA